MIKIGIAFCILAFSTDIAAAQPTIYRDGDGPRTGSAEQQGETTIFRDKQGNRTGSAQQEGGTLVFRDKQGNRTGSVEQQGRLR